MRKYSDQIQRFGRSLLLPIGVMAPIGLLLGVSGAFTQGYMVELLPFLGTPTLKIVFTTIRTVSDLIFNNIPLLFAMGVAYGMSKKEKGIAVFASVLGYLMLLVTIRVYLVNTETLAAAADIAVSGQATVLGIQTLNINVLGGIIAGLVAAWATDKYYNLELPVALAFFGGKKSVPLIVMGVTFVIGIILPFFWQYFITFTSSLSGLLLHKIWGPVLSGFVNRMMIPFGLHHVWNSMLRFTEAGGTYVINGETYIGYLGAMNQILFNLGPESEYWKLMPELTRFGAQNQMIRTMFVFPAIGLAMYNTAYNENKTLAKSLIVTAVVTAFLGNVTEPLEFTFLFIAPILYVLYALVGTVASLMLYFMGTAVGYIRGTVFDFIIFGVLYENSGWINIVIVGIVMFVLNYFMFKWYILKFDVKTPGREDAPSNDNVLIREKRYAEIASLVVEALGGKSNIGLVENCITRLRVDINDNKKIDRDLLMKTGCSGIFFPTNKHIHIVFGPLVEFVKNAVDEEMKK